MALNENPTLDEIINEAERLNNLIIDRGGAKTITPSTSNQVLGRGNYKGDITVLGDSDLVQESIVDGKNVFGVEGSVTGVYITPGDDSYFNIIQTPGGLYLPQDYRLLDTSKPVPASGTYKIPFRFTNYGGTATAKFVLVRTGEIMIEKSSPYGGDNISFEYKLKKGDIIQVWGKSTGKESTLSASSIYYNLNFI